MFINDSGVPYSKLASGEYSMYIDNIKEQGLKFAIKYDSFINTTVSYKYIDFKGIESEY
jgi:hypothetical protein